MLKNLSFLALAGALTFATSMTGCVIVTDDGSDDEVGDGDGDQTTGEQPGDGDGDEPGDGDGDEPGDGDGDEPGDGDGDEPGDGDGDEPGSCGWSEDVEEGEPIGYYCGGEGEDPTGATPLNCPEDLVEGEPCGTVTGAGCCDADGNVWYCAKDEEDDSEYLAFEAC